MGAHSRVDANAVHTSTGIPSPDAVDTVLRMLFDPRMALQAKVQKLQETLIDNGYSAEDMLQLVHERLVDKADVDLKRRLLLNVRLADIDWRLKQGCSEPIQAAALVGAFHEAATAP